MNPQALTCPLSNIRTRHELMPSHLLATWLLMEHSLQQDLSRKECNSVVSDKVFGHKKITHFPGHFCPRQCSRDQDGRSGTEADAGRWRTADGRLFSYHVTIFFRRFRQVTIKIFLNLTFQVMPAPSPLPITTPTISQTTDNYFSSTGFCVVTHNMTYSLLLINVTDKTKSWIWVMTNMHKLCSITF